MHSNYKDTENKVDTLLFVLSKKPWTLLFVLAYSASLVILGYVIGK